MFNNANTPVDTEALTDIVTEAAESVSEAVTEAGALSFTFEPMNFVNNLTYLVSGMIGIFAVIGVIIIATAILNKVTFKKK